MKITQNIEKKEIIVKKSNILELSDREMYVMKLLVGACSNDGIEEMQEDSAWSEDAYMSKSELSEVLADVWSGLEPIRIADLEIEKEEKCRNCGR